MQVKDAAWDGVFVDLMSQEVQNRSQIRVGVLQKPRATTFLSPVMPSKSGSSFSATMNEQMWRYENNNYYHLFSTAEKI